MAHIVRHFFVCVFSLHRLALVGARRSAAPTPATERPQPGLFPLSYREALTEVIGAPCGDAASSETDCIGS